MYAREKMSSATNISMYASRYKKTKAELGMMEGIKVRIMAFTMMAGRGQRDNID